MSPPLQVEDFSFLARCKKLKKLDLHATSFTDCALLAELPALKQAYLPARNTLEHVEVLDGLSCEVKTDERELSGGALPDDEYIPPSIYSVPFRDRKRTAAAPPAGIYSLSGRAPPLPVPERNGVY